MAQTTAGMRRWRVTAPLTENAILTQTKLMHNSKSIDVFIAEDVVDGKPHRFYLQEIEVEEIDASGNPINAAPAPVAPQIEGMNVRLEIASRFAAGLFANSHAETVGKPWFDLVAEAMNQADALIALERETRKVTA